MDKVIFLCILFFISCTSGNKYDEKDYNLVFYYNPWIEINLKTQVIKINYDSLNYVDTLDIPKNNIDYLIQSFNENTIYKIEGEILLTNETLKISPRSDFVIKILCKDKIQAELIIDDNLKKEDVTVFNEKYKLLIFRDDIVGVLSNNKKFENAISIFSAYDKKLWEEHKVKF